VNVIRIHFSQHGVLARDRRRHSDDGFVHPQVSRAWRTKSTGDLSLGMLVTFNAGVLCWFLYGWLTGQLVIVLANLVTLALALSLLFLKLRWG
jgi:MtN3 and saliva related transmembrane protein